MYALGCEVMTGDECTISPVEFLAVWAWLVLAGLWLGSIAGVLWEGLRMGGTRGGEGPGEQEGSSFGSSK